jgi:hypothetical protein
MYHVSGIPETWKTPAPETAKPPVDNRFVE